jgi:hypothetical protein
MKYVNLLLINFIKQNYSQLRLLISVFKRRQIKSKLASVNNNIIIFAHTAILCRGCIGIVFVHRYCSNFFAQGMKIQPYTPNIRSCGICGGNIRNGANFSLTALIFSPSPSPRPICVTDPYCEHMTTSVFSCIFVSSSAHWQ